MKFGILKYYIQWHQKINHLGINLSKYVQDLYPFLRLIINLLVIKNSIILRKNLKITSVEQTRKHRNKQTHINKVLIFEKVEKQYGEGQKPCLFKKC